MLRHVIRHELRSLASDRMVWVASAALLLLSGYAAHVGFRSAESQRMQVEAALTEEAERYSGLRSTMEGIRDGTVSASAFQDPTRPYVAARSRGQRYAVLPPSRFQATAVGQSDLIPPVVPVILDGADPRAAREEIENPVHLLSGPLDLAFLVTFLLPLMALALSFDLLSREREGGTLALILSQPVSLRSLVLMKVTVRWGVLLLLMAGSAGLALLVVGAGLPADRFLIWTAIVSLYLAFWVGLAALVNAGGGDSARNAVVLAFCWLLFAILLPAGVQITSGLLHPIPSRAEIVALERDEEQQVAEEAAAVLARYYDDHPELLPPGSIDEVDFQTQAFAVEEEVRQRLAPLRERYTRQLQGQQDVTRAFRWISPSILVHEGLLTLAGTGDDRMDHFEGQVASFHAQWLDFFSPLIYAGARLEPEDLGRVPTWDFLEQSTASLRARLLPNLLGLFVFAGAVFLAAHLLVGGTGERRWRP